MRKQYYFRPSDRGLLAWDVDRLVMLSSHLPRKRVPLSQTSELDEAVCGEGETLTWRSLLEHVKLMDEADLSFPIILSASGAVMDGRHRIAKGVARGPDGSRSGPVRRRSGAGSREPRTERLALLTPQPVCRRLRLEVDSCLT